METLFQNKQALQYVLFLGEQPVYQTDASGNIVYENIHGKQTPIKVGKYNEYSEPVEFNANISFKSGESEAVTFGVSQGDYDSILTMMKGEIPITETSLIFFESTPEYDTQGHLKVESADFTVKKIAPSLNQVTYLLKRIVQ